MGVLRSGEGEERRSSRKLGDRVGGEVGIWVGEWSAGSIGRCLGGILRVCCG